jgi:hypothetical protein
VRRDGFVFPEIDRLGDTPMAVASFGFTLAL